MEVDCGLAEDHRQKAEGRLSCVSAACRHQDDVPLSTPHRHPIYRYLARSGQLWFSAMADRKLSGGAGRGTWDMSGVRVRKGYKAAELAKQQCRGKAV